MVQIPIPIPLKYVNCYLCRGPSGWTLVDGGFHDPLATDAWPRAFADIGIRAQDVDQILVTHYHPDHFGAAGWLQELTGAPAFMHDKEFPQVERFWGSMSHSQTAALQQFFIDEGMPRDIATAITEVNYDHLAAVQPLAQLQPLATDSIFRIGDRHYEIHWTPGHSDGLAVFYNPESGVVLANDMILQKITPNVSLWPGSSPNPLENYLDSLVKMEHLGAKLALTGHRNLITDVAGRSAEIRHHHADRLDKMEKACDGLHGATGWEVCEQIFNPDTLTIHQVRFAMSEALAHLVYMEKQGRLLKKGVRFVQA